MEDRILNAKLLQSKNYCDGKCYLCEVKLNNYIESLSGNFDEYFIQRGIVKNIYLDKMSSTIFENQHIPVITLVAKSVDIDDKNNAKIKNIDIIDGLQRTERIKRVVDTTKLIKTQENTEKLIINYEFKKQLVEIKSNIKTAEAIFSFLQDETKKDRLESATLWVEIWIGLSEKAIVDKMILLNAGHKQVKIRHQLEILFMQLFENFNSSNKIKLTREKNSASIASFAQKRIVGEFRLSDIVVGYLAFKECEPIYNSADIVNERAKSDSNDSLEEMFDLKYDDIINYSENILYEIDGAVCKQYENDGKTWLAKEAVISGLSAAIGKYAKEEDKKFNDIVVVIKNNITLLNLEQYEIERNHLQTSKINIGDVTKKTIYIAVYKFLCAPIKIDWALAFKGE